MKFSASILSADFMNLEKDIKKAEEAGCYSLHLDVMDGHFVRNIAIGLCTIERIKTTLRKDAHLYVTQPENFIDDFIKAGVDSIIFHAEANPHYYHLINEIKKYNKLAGIALSPETPIGRIEQILDDIDIVLLVSVPVGFGGQSFIPNIKTKLQKLKTLKVENNYNYEIQVDGGINASIAKEVNQCGAEVLVAGSMIFESKDLNKTLLEARGAVQI